MNLTSLLLSIGSRVRYDDWVTDHISFLLHRILLTATGGSAVVLLTALSIQPPRVVYLSTVSLILCTACYIMYRIGYMTLTRYSFTLFLLLFSLYAIGSGDGIHDVAMVLIPAVLLICSLLFTVRVYTIYAVIAICAVAGIGAGELAGLLDTKYAAYANWLDYVLITLFITVAALFIHFLTHSLLQALQRVQQSERNYREIFNATSEAIFIHDAHTGAILDVNDTMLNMYGYEKKDIAHLTVSMLSSGEYPYTDQQAIEKARKAMSEGPQLFLWQAQRKNGTFFWAEISLRPTQVGGVNRLLAVVRDVDEKVVMEQKAQQTEKMRVLGQLAGGVAHDFNNQLSGILVYTEMLQKDISHDPQTVKLIDNILAAARRAAGLARKLLHFARRGSVVTSVMDVDTVINETTTMLERIVDPRVGIRVRSDANPHVVKGDADQLHNAFLNMGINAGDAMPDGGTITFDCSNVTLSSSDIRRLPHDIAPGAYVKIRIEDTGTGIDASTQGKIFEPFFTTKPADKGTGMGLSVVYGVVEEHGGSIEFESTEGKGTSFFIYLPQTSQQETQNDPTAASPSPSSSPASANDQGDARAPDHTAPDAPPAAHVSSHSPASPAIMVVDDESFVLSMLGEVLTEYGYRRRLFRSAHQALAFFREYFTEIDLVILDMRMPAMSGHDLFYALRKINPYCRVLIMSGYDDSQDIRTLQNDGARGFLPKPFSRDACAAAIKDALA